MRPGSIQSQVVEVLHGGPRRTVDVCRELSAMDDTAIAIALRRLRARGLVMRIDHGPLHGRGHHAMWSLAG